MNGPANTSSAGVARLRGERIGHLSRYNRIDLLQEEMADFANDVRLPQARYNFRKAFFGAGGKQEHWDRFAEPLLANYPSGPPTTGPAPSPDVTSSLVQALASDASPEAGPPADEQDTAQPATEAVEETKGADEEESGEFASPAYAVPEIEDASLPFEGVAEGIIAVRPEGEFGSGQNGGSDLQNIVSRHIEQGGKGVLLDLTAVERLRADASGPLLACYLKLQAVSGELAIVVQSESASTLLEVTGIARRTPCFDAEEDALAHLQSTCGLEPIGNA